MKKIVLFSVSFLALSVATVGAEGDDRFIATTTASGTQVFIDINKDGQVGPFERKIFNRILEDKNFRNEVLVKNNITPEELQKALATSTNLGQVIQYFQAKGVALTDEEKRDVLKKITNSASTTLEQAWKRGEISREQKDRIKATGEDYLKELNRKLEQASSTLKASTSASFMNNGFRERINAFWAKFFRKTATTTATSTK